MGCRLQHQNWELYGALSTGNRCGSRLVPLRRLLFPEANAPTGFKMLRPTTILLARATLWSRCFFTIPSRYDTGCSPSHLGFRIGHACWGRGATVRLRLGKRTEWRMRPCVVQTDFAHALISSTRWTGVIAPRPISLAYIREARRAHMVLRHIAFETSPIRAGIRRAHARVLSITDDRLMGAARLASSLARQLGGTKALCHGRRRSPHALRVGRRHFAVCEHLCERGCHAEEAGAHSVSGYSSAASPGEVYFDVHPATSASAPPAPTQVLHKVAQQCVRLLGATIPKGSEYKGERLATRHRCWTAFHLWR